MPTYSLCFTYPEAFNEDISNFCQLLKAMNTPLDYIQGETSIPHTSLCHFKTETPVVEIAKVIEPLFPLMQKLTAEAILVKPREDRKSISLFLEEQDSLKTLQEQLISTLTEHNMEITYLPKNFHLTLMLAEVDSIVSLPDEQKTLINNPQLCTPSIGEINSLGCLCNISYKK